MANDTNGAALANAPAAISPTTALFQKAHAKLVTLQRVDEQLTGLFDQRRKLQDELREVQAQINDEFERVIRDSQESPTARLAGQFNDQAKIRRGNPAKDAIRLEVAQAG